MSDEDRDRDSSVLELGERLLNAVGDGNTGSEWREEVESAFGGEGEVDYDRLATAGVLAGEQVARLREQTRTPTRQKTESRSQNASVEVRDMHGVNGGYAGTKLFVSADDPNAYLSADGEQLVVRFGGVGRTFDLPQPATRVVEDEPKGAGITMYVAYPDGSVFEDAGPDTDDVDGLTDVPQADTDTGDAENNTPANSDGDPLKWVDESRLDEDADE